MANLKLVGETWQEFVKKNGIRTDGTNKCVICKKEFSEPTDWHYFKDTAVVSWKHDNCRNNGPCKAMVTGESAKEITHIMDELF